MFPVISEMQMCRRIACRMVGMSMQRFGCAPFRRRNDPLFSSIQTSILSVRMQNNSTTKRLPFEAETRVSQDVLLFRYENRRFYRMLTLFAASQFIFWSYLSHFAYTTLRDVSRDDEEKRMTAAWKEEKEEQRITLVWWRRINFGENKYRIGISVLCASIGYVILAGAWLYTMRTVRTLTLVKGGLRVRLACYSPWGGRDRIVDVPLNDLSCELSRQQVNSHLPIKIRGYWMYFLLDKSGTYTDTKLFDYTAGLKRLWTKQN